MSLAYNRDRVTRDLDAVFEPKREIYDEAARMSADLGLPDGWLNDSVKGLLPDLIAPDPSGRHRLPHGVRRRRVSAPRPRATGMQAPTTTRSTISEALHPGEEAARDAPSTA